MDLSRKLAPAARVPAVMRQGLALVLYVAAQAASAAASAPVAGEQLTVSLLSERDALVPGARNWLGLRLQHAPHWHTYWINPGDSGLPTKLAWHLPEGLRAGDIAWPAPQRIRLGELYNFGYVGDVVLPVPLDVPPSASGRATLTVDAKWLVCEDRCIPGQATLTLDLPLRADAAADAANAALFASARAAQPQIETRRARAEDTGTTITVLLPRGVFENGSDAFVAATQLVANAPPRVLAADSGTRLEFAKSDYFTTAPAAFDLVITRPRAAPLMLRAQFERQLSSAP